MKLGRRAKSVRYPSIDKQFGDSDCGRVITSVAKRHGLMPRKDIDALSVICGHMMRFGEAVGVLDGFNIDLDRLRQLKVLDLACGSRLYVEKSKHIPGMDAALRRSTGPWMCRLLSELGVDVTGVDMYHPNFKKGKGGTKLVGVDEPGWRFVQRDLISDGLDPETFPTGSADVVYCQKFIGSDELDIMDEDPSITMFRLHHPASYEIAVAAFRLNVFRVLKPGGLFILNRWVETREAHEFKRVRTLNG